VTTEHRSNISWRTFKYRLYPNRHQRESLQATLDVCRELYNAGLQERGDAWSSHREGIGYRAQANQLGEIKEIREDVRAVHSQVLQDVLRRVDKTFQAFFLRCQRGQVPGFPRFRSGPASVVRVEHQTSNSFPIVSMFALIADCWIVGTGTLLFIQRVAQVLRNRCRMKCSQTRWVSHVTSTSLGDSRSAVATV
jgi:hypothetical protein